MVSFRLGGVGSAYQAAAAEKLSLPQNCCVRLYGHSKEKLVFSGRNTISYNEMNTERLTI